MTTKHCAREAEVIRLAWSGRQLEPASELVSHAARCATCADALALAAAFRWERDAACSEARLPSAGLLWWKAQLRSRREQAQAASRPILVAQAVSLFALFAAALAVAAWLVPPARLAIAGLPTVSLPSLCLPRFNPGLLADPGILLVAGAALALLPVALYLALSRD